jgi:protein TonB
MASAGPGGATGVGTGTAGAGRGAFGNGKGSGDDYLARLQNHIRRFKRPLPDELRGKDGKTWITIVLARDGTILDAQIKTSSGFPTFDQMTLAMVRAASPVPPPPAEAPNPAKISLQWDLTPGFFDKVFR